jgi:CRISPR-associated protein Cmr4
MANRFFILHALSPVHVGTGSGTNYIDLPVAREKVTDWPVVPGSGIKGVMSDKFGASDEVARRSNKNLRAAFGAADGEDESGANSGALVFSDAQLLCMPVRSVYGTFAWVTCPWALSRLERDFTANGDTRVPALPSIGSDDAAYITTESCLASPGSKIFLAEADFGATRDQATTKMGEFIAKLLFPENSEWQKLFRQRFAVVSDDKFTFFTLTGTEVATRVRINSGTGTVEKGALWTEESLPVEAVLAGVVWCDTVYHGRLEIAPNDLLNQFCGRDLYLQIGGKATTGHGRVRMSFQPLGGEA